jgi:hypothetical protein
MVNRKLPSMQTPGKNLKIWCLLQDQFAHVKPVEAYMEDRAEFIYDGTWDPEVLLKARPDLVLCVNDQPYDIAKCLDAARESGIPSLILQDGVLEWRCLYENPQYGAGGGPPWHQPVLPDKIACLGRQSARQIAAWGNADKVEITGMPRLDGLLGRKPQARPIPGNRILVMTAKKPWFQDSQKEVILRSLFDIKNYFDKNSTIEVVWRITKKLERAINVANQLQELATNELVNILERVDGVITTPSTTILEAMLLNKPVAVLDYLNTPRFIPTSWTISAPEHIAMVVDELMNPPLSKVLFQGDILRECLRCDGPAASHVDLLITKMVELASRQRNSGLPLKFPPHLLGNEETFPASPPLPLAELYPGQTVFTNNDIQALQVRLSRLNSEHAKVLEELKSRSLGFWIAALGRYISNKIKG